MKFFFENKDRSVYIRNGQSLQFGAHLHTHVEMVYLLEGTARVIIDSQEYIFGAGDFLLVFPNQIHEYRHIGAENYLIAIIPPNLCPEYQGILTSQVPVDPVLRQDNTVILSCLRRIFDLDHSEQAYIAPRVKGYFLVVLGEAFRHLTFSAARLPNTDTVKTVLDYCLENYTSGLSLESLSEALHLNKYYLSHLFTQKLHIKFGDYIATLRVSKACEWLLNTDDSITNIAYQAGFNSPRSFNRLFYHHVGLTPRDYRAARRAGDTR